MMVVNCYKRPSAVSRTNLKPIYPFAITNWDPQTPKSRKINSCKSRQIIVQSHKNKVLSYLVYKIATIFWRVTLEPTAEGLKNPSRPRFHSCTLIFVLATLFKKPAPPKFAGCSTGPQKISLKIIKRGFLYISKLEINKMPE